MYCSCRYTVYHTENSNHLDQNIGTIWHKRSMIVNDNPAEYNISQKKETVTKISTISIEKTFQDNSRDVKSRLVGFLKQAKNRVND